jgi:hypothetical protein
MDGSGFIVRLLPDSPDVLFGNPGPGFIVMLLPGADASAGAEAALTSFPGAASIGDLAWKSARSLPSTGAAGSAGTLTESARGGAGDFSSGFSSGFGRGAGVGGGFAIGFSSGFRK